MASGTVVFLVLPYVDPLGKGTMPRNFLIVRSQFTPGTTYFGETIPPFERPDRVKNRSAVGMISGFPFLWRHARIQRVLQQPSMISMLVLGSTRVIIAQSTSFILVGSMSSSTTTT